MIRKLLAATLFIIMLATNSFAATNLLTNGGAETGDLTGWTVTANGGNGWAVGGGGSDMHSGSYAFLTSSSWDIMEQTIDLLAAGYSSAQLDAEPSIAFSLWTTQRFDHSGNYFCTFKLLAADGVTVVTSESFGSQSSPISLSAGTAYFESAKTFTNYGSGARYAYFQLGGDDGVPAWGGHYGPYFDDASISISDTTGPTLESISWSDQDSSNSINQNDTLTFTFSEAMSQETVNDVDTELAPDTGNYGTSGASDFSWTSSTTLVATLGAGTTFSINSTVNPTDAVSDEAGNADETAAPGPAINAHTIVATSSAGGTIFPTGTAVKNNGNNLTFYITPEAGYGLSTLYLDGSTITATTEYTFLNITTNHSIEAVFTINTFSITSEAGSGGSISPLGATSKNYGSSQTYTITPNTGYGLDTLTVDGSTTTATSEYTFPNITANHTIEANFIITTVDAPTNCTATTASTSQINLSWTNNASVITENRIEKSTDGITYTKIATTDSDTTSYSAIGLSTNTKCWLRVRAENSGTYSNYATAEAKYTLAEAVAAGTSESRTTTSITVSWEAGNNPAGTYYYCENRTQGTDSGWITDTGWTSSSLTAETDYTFRVKAKNGNDTETAWYSIGTISTSSETTSSGTQAATISIGTATSISGDIISNTPKISATVISSASASSLSKGIRSAAIDINTFRIYIDGNLVTDGSNTYYDSVTQVSGVATFEYTPKTPLSSGTHTIRVTFSDTMGTNYEAELSGLTVMTTAQVVGNPLCYPNPYNPNTGNVRISYYLATDTDISVYIFNAQGEIQWKNNYNSGAAGGQAGYNEITWNGRNMFEKYIMNNVYLIRIVKSSDKSLLGKARLAVIK